MFARVFLGTKRVAQLVRSVSIMKVGDKVPTEGAFMVLGEGPAPLPYKEVFDGKRVVVFGIPGALTPTCTETQLPGFVAQVDAFKAKGIDTVACLAVNDPFVMSHMQKLRDPENKLIMLGDGGAAFVKATGLDVDTGNFGGVRCQRCSFLVKDGVVEIANLEGGTGFTATSAAETILGQI